MNQSTPTVHYISPPPSVPPFLSGRVSHLRNLIRWSKDEHQRWIIRCTENGYYRYLKVLNEEYSPIRFLAEMPGFRNVCAQITQNDWNTLSGRERKYIRAAFELRDQLFRN